MNAPETKSPAVVIPPQPAAKFQPAKFIHERSPQFRTYHADGGWAIVNALGDIHVSFFTEYPKLATGSINQVDPMNGIYTGKFELLGASDPDYFIVIREFQCSVVLSIPTAERIRNLLGSFIEIAKKSVADQKAREQKAREQKNEHTN